MTDDGLRPKEDNHMDLEQDSPVPFIYFIGAIEPQIGGF
jgi:hypothetical protein